jgi:hypothetical protein
VREILHVCDSNGDGFSDDTVFWSVTDYREKTMLLEHEDRWYLLCFAWISEQTATVYLHSISWLVIITAKESIYCAVRT